MKMILTRFKREGKMKILMEEMKEKGRQIFTPSVC